MAIISKFVINRNKIGFFYVEKSFSNNAVSYSVNDGTQTEEMSQETFHSIFGNDKKYSLLRFVEKVQIDILNMLIEDERIPKLGLQTIDVADRLKRDVYQNPSMTGYSFSFISILKTYNSLLLKVFEEKKANEELLHDYEVEYERIQGYQRKQEF